MDAIEIVLFFVVSFSVLGSLIIGYLEGRIKSCRESGDNVSDYEEDEKIAAGGGGGDGGTGEQISLEDFCSFFDNIFEDFRQTEEEEGGEIPVGAESSVYDISVEREEELMDDWEGIDRTELEKVFGAAMVFINDHDHQIDEDLKSELFGLSRIALEGPCFQSQPTAFKVSARAKWNAWHILGNMNRETAMEKYIDILSNAIPRWKGENARTS